MGKSNTYKPELDKKKAVQISGASVIRYKEPTAKTVNVMTQFVHDYSTFQKHTPNRVKGALVEATQSKKSKADMQSINPSTNRSMVFGPSARVSLGSSNDDKGNY